MNVTSGVEVGEESQKPRANFDRSAGGQLREVGEKARGAKIQRERMSRWSCRSSLGPFDEEKKA